MTAKRLPSPSTTFLGLHFEPVRLEHKNILTDYLNRFPQKIAGYSFASLIAWAETYGFLWAKLHEDCLLLARPYNDGEKQRLHLLQPIGAMTNNCLSWLLIEAKKLDYPLKILSVSKDFLENNELIIKDFYLEEDRSGANYIYLASDLATLQSAKYGKKRNLISQFLKLYPNWQVVPLHNECCPSCLEILYSTAKADGISTDDPSLKAELVALEFTLKHYQDLDQKGVVIIIDNKPVAFSIFERQNEQTAVVHFEKADRQYKGLYQIINRETSKQIQSLNYTLINREEDVGNEGLRKAKLSYAPVELYSIFNLTLISN